MTLWYSILYILFGTVYYTLYSNTVWYIVLYILCSILHSMYCMLYIICTVCTYVRTVCGTYVYYGECTVCTCPIYVYPVCSSFIDIAN